MENPVRLKLLAAVPILCSQKMKRQRRRGGGGVAKNTVTATIRPERVKVPLIRSPDNRVLIRKTLRALETAGVRQTAMIVGTLRANVTPPIAVIRTPKTSNSLLFPGACIGSLQLTEPLAQLSIMLYCSMCLANPLN